MKFKVGQLVCLAPAFRSYQCLGVVGIPSDTRYAYRVYMVCMCFASWQRKDIPVHEHEIEALEYL